MTVTDGGLVVAALVITVGAMALRAELALRRAERDLARTLRRRYDQWHDAHDWVGPSERTGRD